MKYGLITTAVIAAALCAACSSAPAESDRAYVPRESEILQDMTTEEKVCQMFIVRPESITGAGTVTQAGKVTKAALKQYPVGGIIYSADNLIDAEQTTEMIKNTTKYSEIAPFISVDEEGGAVARVAQKLGTTRFEPMYSYKGEGKAGEIYSTIAGDIKQFGFNLDFAPVADVWTNPENKVIGTRAFSDNPSEAADMVGAAVTALQDNGVCAAIKHFPGHGDTAGDSHEGFVYTSKTLDELRECELVPFKAGIAAGADFVMVGHIIAEAVDSAPATLSKAIVTDILKGELGFDGIVITDGMEMGAIADNYTAGDAAVKAIEAGCDVILEPESFTEAKDAVLNAVETGVISESRIDESVEKILRCKLDRGIIE